MVVGTFALAGVRACMIAYVELTKLVIISLTRRFERLNDGVILLELYDHVIVLVFNIIYLCSAQLHFLLLHNYNRLEHHREVLKHVHDIV